MERKPRTVFGDRYMNKVLRQFVGSFPGIIVSEFRLSFYLQNAPT